MHTLGYFAAIFSPGCLNNDRNGDFNLGKNETWLALLNEWQIFVFEI
jgi:hypothetical protein